ncbi:hypothetical protein [Azospirillum sp. A39]|uniref:hypothetical protein n=1 Tax=Azospirillum sp. A39 TaxID=3462279 RepID=UPI004046796C
MGDLSLTCCVALTDYPPGLDGPAGDHLAGVLSDVATAQVRRVANGCTAAHDDRFTTAGFEDLFYEEILNLDARSDRIPEYRESLVLISALAVAAVQRWDRLHGRAPT